jgi:hypothetical protein
MFFPYAAQTLFNFFMNNNPVAVLVNKLIKFLLAALHTWPIHHSNYTRRNTTLLPLGAHWSNAKRS